MHVPPGWGVLGCFCSPRVIGTEKPTYLWDYDAATIASWPQSKAVEAIFAKAIAADAENSDGYSSRGNFRWGIGDYKNGLADLDKVTLTGLDAEPVRVDRGARLGLSGDPIGGVEPVRAERGARWG